MPHIVIEYSDNLKDAFDVGGFVKTAHEAALKTGIFPIGGLRTRAVERKHYRIADGHPDNAFVHILLRIGHGRTLEVKKKAGQDVFDALCAFLAPLFNARPLGISFEITEIDPDLGFRKNNLHDYVEIRKASG